MTKPQLVVVAGPNGAGKSTFYDAFLSESPLPYLDPDKFGEELNIEPEDAAKLLDALRDRMLDDKTGFITETVFSDPVGAKLAMIKKAIDQGYDVRLVYIGLANVELSGKRVDQRLATGGHDVPRNRLAGRFERSLKNLAAAIGFVPIVEIYDNSSVDHPYMPVARFEAGALVSRMPGTLPKWARSVVPKLARR